MGLSNNKFTNLKCLRCSKFVKLHHPEGGGVLDPKFDVESNGDGPRELPNNNTLITIPRYVSGTVTLGSFTDQNLT